MQSKRDTHGIDYRTNSGCSVESQYPGKHALMKVIIQDDGGSPLGELNNSRYQGDFEALCRASEELERAIYEIEREAANDMPEPFI